MTYFESQQKRLLDPYNQSDRLLSRHCSPTRINIHYFHPHSGKCMNLAVLQPKIICEPAGAKTKVRRKRGRGQTHLAEKVRARDQ